jgi:hypothetical protein
MTRRIFRTSCWPIPVFSGIWIVLVLVVVAVTARRNGQALTEILTQDASQIVLYCLLGIVASVGAVALGWTHVELGDGEITVRRLRELVTGRKTIIPFDAIRSVEETYSALARSHVTAVTLEDGGVVKIGHHNLVRGDELVRELRALSER